MTAASPAGVRRADVEAALLLLDRMGITPADLAAAASPSRAVQHMTGCR